MRHTTLWAIRRNARTRRLLMLARLARLGLAALLCSATLAAAESKPPKPVACLNFKVYVAEDGKGKLVVCYDNKRPYTFESATITKLPNGQPVAVGFR